MTNPSTIETMNTTFEITRGYTMKTNLISSVKSFLNPASFRLIAIVMILFLSFLGRESFAQGVGISESTITPDANAILELRSTLRGFLAPRLTTSQRNTLGLIPPSYGMLVYDSQLNTFYYWNGDWVAISAGAVANGLTLTPLTIGFSIAGGSTPKTLTLNNTLGFSGTDGTTMTFPTTSATLARTDAANTFTGHQTIEGVTATGATGTGSMVYGTSPTFTGTVTLPTPFILGATSVTTTGTKLNYLSAATGTTGTTTTNLVFSTSPTLVTPSIGAATGTSLSVTGQLTSTVATGTAPLVVTSTTPVSNLSIGGSAAKWTTARNLAGNSVDGSANVAFSNKFIVQGTTDTGLSGAQFLGVLTTGLLKNTNGTGVLSIATPGTDYAAGVADPSASIGLNAVNGIANTAMRSDAAPALNVSIIPTWTGAHTWSALGTFNLGLAASGGTVNLNAGSDNITNINTGSSTGAVNIANGSTGGNTISIGNTNGATSLTENVGSGNYTLNGAAGSTYTIGSSTTNGTISIGGTAQTGGITVGASSAAQTVDIGTGAGASTVHIANGGAASTVVIGDNTGATSGTTLIGGSTTINGSLNYAADAQANDSYVITLSPAPTAYTIGMQIVFRANTANSGAASINVNGLGVKTIVKRVSTILGNNDIAALKFCLLVYDGTNFVLLNPASL